MRNIEGVKGFISVASDPDRLVLLHRRLPRANGSTIDIPGGHLDVINPEAPLEDQVLEGEASALVREAHEEAGLRVVARTLHKVNHHSVLVDDGYLERGYYVGVAAVMPDGFVPDGNEIDDAFLCTPDEALRLPGLEALVRHALEDLVVSQ